MTFRSLPQSGVAVARTCGQLWGVATLMKQCVCCVVGSGVMVLVLVLI